MTERDRENYNKSKDPTSSEMSMDDILASIRRYVSDETSSSSPEKENSSYNSGDHERSDPFLSSRYKMVPQRHDMEKPEDTPIIRLTEDIPLHSLMEKKSKESPGYQDRIMREPEQAPSSLLNSKTYQASSQAFQRLAQSLRSAKISSPEIKIEEPISNTDNHQSALLASIVRDMMRPMIKQWLDANLPQIVEKIVENEIKELKKTHRSS